MRAGRRPRVFGRADRPCRVRRSDLAYLLQAYGTVLGQ
ncbi:hypothetical protein OK006_3418 [Actinobacteria bacterium OK006]|nr:hypothetical protein OK006_3418 [Actinobacteria bacterium OK006]